MAGPQVFVRGPSVSPNLGTPATYLRQINDVISGVDEDRRRNKLLDQNKIFQDATLEQGERKQDYVEGAPQRTEDLRMAAMAREQQKITAANGMAEGAQFVGGDRMTGIESELQKDARYSSLDDAGRLAARNEFINKNPASITTAKRFGEVFRKSLGGSGLYTRPEIDQIVAGELGRRYPTADPKLIQAQFLKPSDFVNKGSGNNTTTNISLGGGGTKSGTNSYSLLSDQINQSGKEATISAELESLGITEKRTGETFGFRHDVNVAGFGTNVTKQNYNQMMAKLERRGASTPASIAVLRDIISGNLTSDIDFRDATDSELNDLAKLAKFNEAQQTQVLNRGTGGVSQAGKGSAGATGGKIFSMADAAKAAADHNQKLTNRLTPNALSDADLVTAFLDQLGPAAGAPAQDDTRQGGAPGGQGQILTPQPAPTPAPAPQVTPGPAVPPVVQEPVDGPPSQSSIFPQPAALELEPSLADRAQEANDRLTVFGNGTPADLAVIKENQKAIKLEESEERVAQISEELKKMPLPDQRTMAQVAYARSLEKELKELKDPK